MNAPTPEKVLATKQTKNVYQKLMDARLKLQATELKKSGHNKFAGYKYFELGDFLPTIQRIFAELGLCGVVSFDNEYAELRITNIDWIDSPPIVIRSPMSTAALKGCHEVQNLGAVQTYIRRYLWVNALEIVEHDALDASEPVKEEKKHLPPVKAAMQSVQIDPESETVLRELAAELVQIVEVEGNPTAAYNRLIEMGVEGDEKLYLWDLLAANSKTRSALKKEGQNRRLGEQA